MSSRGILTETQRLSARLDGALTFDALLRLRETLGIVCAEVPTRTPEERRLSSFLALGAVIDFMHSLGWDDLDDPLHYIFCALEEVESGRAPSMLVPRRVPGKPGRPRRTTTATALMAVRGRIAAIQEMLMRAGRDKVAAAEFIFDALGLEAVAKLRGDSEEPPTWRTVDRWRDDAIGCAVGPAADGFRHGARVTDVVSEASTPLAVVEVLATHMLRGLLRRPP